MRKLPFHAYVATDTAMVFATAEGRDLIASLLWGDGVQFVEDEIRSGRRKVRMRGRTRVGWIDEEALEGGEALLELYFIDVGQGDGVLIRTPDFRHILIDGGYSRSKQNTHKSAGDFVDWKFFEDYALDRIELDAMIASHNDEDHYGGLADLLDPEQYVGGLEFDAAGVAIENFYHAGLSWWNDDGKRTLGPVGEDARGRPCFTRLLGDRASVEAAVVDGAAPQLQGMWRQFIEKVVTARRTDGTATPVSRFNDAMGYLPGFEPGGSDRVAVRVLGPIGFEVEGDAALPVLGASDSKSTNGNSAMLRLDYGSARILLTGDLNLAAHRLILEHLEGREEELACDVAKACHHGSDDVSFRFLAAVNAAATVISSGDGEGHDHPRPAIVAASGLAGHREIHDDRVITPLIYCTELARGVSLGKPIRLDVEHEGDQLMLQAQELGSAVVTYTEQKPGDLRARTRSRSLANTDVVAGLVYGLVNVRTDGRKILVATMNEAKGDWSIRTFQSRF